MSKGHMSMCSYRWMHDQLSTKVGQHGPCPRFGARHCIVQPVSFVLASEGYIRWTVRRVMSSAEIAIINEI